jgi:ferredoxin
MADVALKYPENVAGKYYVDETCIFCNLCESLAPSSFRAADAGTHDFVFKQPETDEEVSAAEEALASCPVAAIGNDGE